MRENFKKTFAGIKLSLRTVPIFGLSYPLLLILFSVIFAAGLPTMIVLEKFFSLVSRNVYTEGEAFNLILIYLLIFFIEAVFTIITGPVLGKAFQRTLLTLRENILTRLMGNRPGTSGLSMGETINSVKTDVRTLVEPADNLLDMPGRLIYGTGAYIMIFRADKTIAVILLIPIISVIFFSNWLSTAFRKQSKESRETAAKVSGLLGDISSNMQTIKVMGASGNMLKRLSKLGHERRRAQVRAQILRQLMWSIGLIVNGFIMFLVLILSAARLKSGTMTIGHFFIFTYFPRTIFLVQLMGRITSLSQSALVSFERIEKLTGKEGAYEIFKKVDLDKDEAEVLKEPKSQGKTLELQGLSSTFSGNSGIKEVGLTVNEGEFLAVTGRIGSGKSVLLKTISGNKEADGGKILYGDEDITETGLIPPFGSLTSQTPNLFSMTVKENIVLGRPYDEEKFREACEDAVLSEDLLNMENGADTLIGSKGVKLSGGQKQRVAVARMLYHDSEVFMLDDVSSALDVVTEEKLWSSLKKRNRTRIAVTTRHAALKNADRILVLKDGRPEATGTFSEVMESSEEFRKIWGTVE